MANTVASRSFIERLRAKGPITKVGRRTWVVTGYEAARFVLRSSAFRVDSSNPVYELGEEDSEGAPVNSDTLMMMEGGDHRRVKRIAAEAFSEKALMLFRHEMTLNAN